jgi:hypothetical protein
MSVAIIDWMSGGLLTDIGSNIGQCLARRRGQNSKPQEGMTLCAWNPSMTPQLPI